MYCVFLLCQFMCFYHNFDAVCSSYHKQNIVLSMHNFSVHFVLCNLDHFVSNYFNSMPLKELMFLMSGYHFSCYGVFQPATFLFSVFLVFIILVLMNTAARCYLC